MASFLDEALGGADRVVSAPSGAEAITVGRERRVESRLQHLQDRLLDESIEHARNAEHAHPAPALLDLPTQHRLRLVGSGQKLRRNPFPVRRQVRRQLLYAHPIQAGSASVLHDSLQRRSGVARLDHLRQQAIAS